MDRVFAYEKARCPSPGARIERVEGGEVGEELEGGVVELWWEGDLEGEEEVSGGCVKAREAGAVESEVVAAVAEGWDGEGREAQERGDLEGGAEGGLGDGDREEEV
jgi:hypothetical protein